MNISKKEIQIIKLLISQSDYLSSYEISEHTGINRRLVRNEMINVKKTLESLGYILTSKASKGYLIEANPPNDLSSLLGKIEQIEQQSYTLFPSLPQERAFYIIRMLLSVNDYIKIDDLANQLLVSRSSISNDLKAVKKILKKDNLHIVQRPGYGIKIEGDEIDCRKPLADILFTNFKDAALFYNLLSIASKDSDLIETTIIETLEKYNIQMSDISLCDFLLTTSINVSRIQLGFSLETSQDISDIQDRIEFIIANEIARNLEKFLNIEFNKAEEIQIGIELISKKSSSYSETYQKEEATRLAKEAIHNIYEKTLIDFTHNQRIINKIIAYNQSALFRQRFKTKLRNPLYLEIKEKYVLGYELANIVSNTYIERNHDSLTLSELSYFAIIFNTALTKANQAKRRVLLICGISNGVRELIEWQIHERFGNELTIVKSTQFYKLRYEKLSNYDLIISTIPLYSTFEIPYILINDMMENEDFNMIKNYLAYSYYNHEIETLFHPKLFISKNKAKDINELSRTMYQLLKDNFNLNDKTYRKILSDSKLTTFRSSNELAIFKSNRAISNSDFIAVILSDKPININNNESRIIVLLSFKDANSHLTQAIVNTLISIAQPNDIVEDILENPTYNNFLKRIKQFK